MKNADMPAMPLQLQEGESSDKITKMGNADGLTKREHFAGLALNGLLSDAGEMFAIVPEGEAPARYFAKMSVNLADALLAELETTQP